MVTYTESNFKYDFAIDDQPFLSAASLENPTIRKTAPWRRDQFDNSNEPGERSLTGWWIRSQSSFHAGAGLNFLDFSSTDDSTDANRFFESENINISTTGEITLLNETEVADTTTATSCIYSITCGATPCVIYINSGSSRTFSILPSTGAASDHTFSQDSATSISWLITTGSHVVLSADTGIYKSAYPATPSTALSWTRLYTGTLNRLFYVKRRLIGLNLAAPIKLYELSLEANAAVLPSPFYTHPDNTGSFNGLTELQSGIYFGLNSSSDTGTGTGTILKVLINDNGSLPVLTFPVQAAALPDNERLLTLGSMLGTYLLIGTRKGSRVGQVVNTSGDIEYGPLISDAEVNTWITRGNIAYGALDNNASLPGSPEFIKLDFSSEISPLNFSYANDIGGTTGGGGGAFSVKAAFFGTTDLKAFVDVVTSIRRETSNKAASGYLTTGKIRYGTTEDKIFRLLKLTGPLVQGTLAVALIEPDGTTTTINTYTQGQTPGDELVLTVPSAPKEWVQLKFTLTRHASTLTLGPKLNSYQLKALPIKRERLIRFPLFCFDFEKDRNGNEIGYQGRALERILAIEAIEETGIPITFQALSGVQTDKLSIIEDLDFQQTAPPHGSNYTNWGGILTVTLRLFANA